MSRKISKTFIIFLIIFVLLMITMFGFMTGYDYVTAQDKRLSAIQRRYDDLGKSPITVNTPGAVEVVIPRAADMSEITDLLKKHGLIDNPLFFKLISKFNGFDGRYQAGTHFLTKELSYDEMMFILTRQPEPITITFPEGLTYQQMKQKMLDAGLRIDERYLDELVMRPNAFIDYPFVRDMVVHSQRQWLLQGYLWPDTYQFDANMNEEAILRVFLNNTQRKLKTEDYQTRAQNMGMTIDQVITLASIIQSEGGIDEMNKIGRVFLNRLQQDMKLESCATINYLRSERNEDPVFWVPLTDIERFKNNHYSTYSHPGLPPGPINNPGTVAIEAVLWPATERTWPGADSYLYFCADGKGNNVFATTLEEHEQNVAYYSSQANP